MHPIKIFLGLLLFLIITPISGNEKNIQKKEFDFQEESKNEIPINDKYLSGLWLIYDCQAKYFACVDKDSFESCKKARKKNLTFNLTAVHPCAPFKKFETRVDCLKEQYRLMQEGGNMSLCLR